MVFIYICRMLQKLKRLSRPPRARYLPAMERTQWPPTMTEHPLVEDDSIGENVECKGHSFAATLADSRMPSDQATREKFGRIWNALKGNTVMGACTLTSSDVHLNAVKLVAVYGDDEGTVVYMTAHTPQTVQRAKAILAKLFETFDQQVKIRIVTKGNIHRFNAIDQARLESMCRTNPMPKIGPPPSGLLPKTKAGLKDYVDVSSDDYDDEDAPVSTTSGLANAPASSWETPHPTLALADAAAPSIMTAEESLADAEDQVTTAGRRLEELNLRTAQTETEQTEISSERTKTQLELGTLTLARDELVDEVREVTLYVAKMAKEHTEALERRRLIHGAPAVVYLVMPPGSDTPLKKCPEVRCAAQRSALLLKRAQTQLGCLGLPLYDLLPHVAKIAFGLAKQGIFPIPMSTTGRPDPNTENRLIDDVLDVALHMENERKSAAENEVPHTCEKMDCGNHTCKRECKACIETKGEQCATCAPCAACARGRAMKSQDCAPCGAIAQVRAQARAQVREKGRDCEACHEADFPRGGLCVVHTQESNKNATILLSQAASAAKQLMAEVKFSKRDMSKHKQAIREILREAGAVQGRTTMSNNCCQCVKGCDPTMFLHYPTQNWWPCDNSQAKEPKETQPAPVLYNKEEMNKTQFVFCDHKCAGDWKTTIICRPCGVNATETKKGKETIPDVGQLQQRTDDIAFVAQADDKYARMSFEEQQELRRNRARDGGSWEDKQVKKARERIQDWDDVREIRVPKCAKCSGGVAPRMCDLNHTGDSNKMNLDAMAGGDSREAQVGSLEWSMNATADERDAMR